MSVALKNLFFCVARLSLLRREYLFQQQQPTYLYSLPSSPMVLLFPTENKRST